MNNFNGEMLENAVLRGWRTRNYSLYYDLPVVLPNDDKDFYIELTKGRLDLVPDHLLWSNLTDSQKANMDKLLEIIRAWWEFPRWISTILFSGVLFFASVFVPEENQLLFVTACLLGGVVIFLTTIIESIIVTFYYIKFLAMNFPAITMLIAWILLVTSTVTALVNSFFISIVIVLGWVVSVYAVNLFTRVIIWRLRRNNYIS